MNSENIFENYLYTKAAQKGIPISGTFELLPVCNLNCKMCYIKKSMSEVKQLGGLRDADEWISLGKRAVDAGMLFLLLTGGEPFLYPEIERLYSSLCKLGLAIDMNTNGTLITEQEVQWMRKNKPRHIKISLYGSSENSYKKLCGQGEAFNKVVQTFDLLKSAGITTYASFTVTPYNLPELDEMYKICKEFKIPVKATSYMYPPLRSSKAHIHEEYRLSAEGAAQATLKIVKHNMDNDAFYQKAKEYSHEKLQNYRNCLSTQGDYGKMHCRAGSCTFWVTWQGYMIPCAMMDFGKFPVMGNNDFLEAWHNTQKVTKNIYTSPECAHCAAKKACYSCAASAFCESGDTAKRPQYICEMTSHYLKLMNQEYVALQNQRK